LSFSKREFLKVGGALAGTAILGGSCGGSTPPGPASIASLRSITEGVEGISVEERRARIAKAQALMTAAGLDAIVIEPGSSMVYFSGIRWWRSERLTALVIPRTGDIAVVTPYFEEPSVRESMTFGDDVRTWHEHENPFTRIAGVLSDRGLQATKIGVEATVRYFVVEGLQALSSFEVSGAQAVVEGCRMYKSAHEIALMQKASEVTLLAYAHVHKNLQAGMSAEAIKSLMAKAQKDLGGKSPWGLALLGPASAYPHGSKQTSEVKEGQIILMDCGCSVEGYQSDISRTFVYGSPSPEQRKMWTAVRQGQQVAFENAQLGRSAGSVDDAVRRYYESLGYGPDYKTPGLSHRTGHGIGMDGHESTNIVRGNATPLAPGMCFSNEPGLYDFSKFGVRLEDCIYMSDTGPRWFTTPPKSIEEPLGTLG
jgi:Xaa-Pro dipeptidase